MAIKNVKFLCGSHYISIQQSCCRSSKDIKKDADSCRQGRFHGGAVSGGNGTDLLSSIVTER